MTPLDLQKAVIAEFTDLFGGKLFKKPRKKVTDAQEMVPLNIFPQALPMEKGYAYSEYIPYMTVQIKGGELSDEQEPYETTIFLNIGIFDDDTSNQGHVTTVDMIEKIRQRLFEKRIIGGKYLIKLPFKFELNDEEIYPYNVAVAETHWNLPLILPKDPNL